jgi:hypothetical protein
MDFHPPQELVDFQQINFNFCHMSSVKVLDNFSFDNFVMIVLQRKNMNYLKRIVLQRRNMNYLKKIVLQTKNRELSQNHGQLQISLWKILLLHVWVFGEWLIIKHFCSLQSNILQGTR